MGNGYSRVLLLSCSSATFVTAVVCLVKTYSAWIAKETLTLDWDLKAAKRGIESINDLPPGLYNRGNLCFANATLQALASVDVLRSALEGSAKDKASPALMSSLYSLLSDLSLSSTNSSRILAISSILNALSFHGWVISHNEQQDAHEFLHILLSTLEDEMTKKPAAHILLNEGVNTKQQSGSTIVSRARSDNAVAPLPRPWRSPFQGSLANTLTCLNCGNQFPVKFETFESLPLICQSRRPDSIASLSSRLKEFTAKEAVHSVSCPFCITTFGESFRTSCVKRLMFAKLPTSLCLYFPRTQFNHHGIAFKDFTHISFPEWLDMSSYQYVTLQNQNRASRERHQLKEILTRWTTSSERSKLLYKLKAVIVHSGQVDDGHFIAYRRHSTYNKDTWLYISDENVSTTTLDKCLASTAYMLFYERNHR